jgi:hypothetical protein
MSEIHRRSLITGLISFVAAPAIVRATSLMPVKRIIPINVNYWISPDGRDDWPRDPAHPFKTIKRAMDLAYGPSDYHWRDITVHVAEGTYGIG